MCVKLVRAHIGPLQTLMTLQDSQGAGTHMDIEGRSRDSTVLTALAHTHVVPYQRDRLKCYHFNPHSFYAGPSRAVPATVTAWISALCWLQQCLFGSRSIAFGPLSTKLVSVTLTATKGRKACGTLSSLSTPVILVSRPITGATTRPNRQCHNFTWSHYGETSFFFSLWPLAKVGFRAAYLLLGPAGLLEHHPGDVGSLRVGHGGGGQVAHCW